MEYLGILACVFLLCNISLPGRVGNLESKIKILNRSIKGNNKMSEILKQLEGKRCRLTLDNTSEGAVECDVISVDDEWMKIIHYEKKDKTTTKIIKIEEIEQIEELSK